MLNTNNNKKPKNFFISESEDSWYGKIIPYNNIISVQIEKDRLRIYLKENHEASIDIKHRDHFIKEYSEWLDYYN